MQLFFARLSHVVWVAALSGLFGSLAMAPAAAQDSTLTRLIGQNQYPLQMSGKQFSGAGWDKIRADAQKSQFVLVGEDHGIAQIPLFTAAVAREFKPAVYVGELDAYEAQAVTRLAAQPGQGAAYLRQYPGSLSFATLAEEFELLRTLRQQGTSLVGIDQVSSLSAAPFYQQLAELATGKAARAYLSQRAATYQAQELANEREGGHTYAMMHQSRGAVDSLLAITKAESPAVRQMAQNYALSYNIYKGQSHQARLDLMKRNLLQAVRPYQTATGLATPPMLFKFGGYHLARGISPIRGGEFYDVGNLVQNLADMQDKKSLHLLILGKQGTKAAGFNLKFPDRNVATYTEVEPPYGVFAKSASGPTWSVFDLCPLREAISAGKLQIPNQSLQRTIMGYDYLIIIPETTASHAM